MAKTKDLTVNDLLEAMQDFQEEHFDMHVALFPDGSGHVVQDVSLVSGEVDAERIVHQFESQQQLLAWMEGYGR